MCVLPTSFLRIGANIAARDSALWKAVGVHAVSSVTPRNPQSYKWYTANLIYAVDLLLQIECHWVKIPGLLLYSIPRLMVSKGFGAEVSKFDCSV